MKTSTSILSVSRLLNFLFTLIVVLFAKNAVAFQSEIIINKSSTVNTNNSANIDFASLVVSATDKSVLINWVTASGQNNSHFEVERSSDMETFKTVALVLDGFNAVGTGKSYKFKEDAGEVRKGKTVYYRLKQVDTDNQVHYSTVMPVQLNTNITVFPRQDDTKVTTNKISVSIKMLSKQSATHAVLNSIPVQGTSYLGSGVLNDRIIMAETAFNFPKLTFA